jgi:hypothetical protein
VPFFCFNNLVKVNIILPIVTLLINIFFNIIIKGFLIARPLLAQHSVGMVKIKLLINDMYLINLFSGLVQNENIATLIY